MRRGIGVALACILLVGVAFGDKHGKGKGHNGDNGESEQHNFNSGIIGSNPGLIIGGVMSGGAPWVVKNGKVTLTPSGELELEVKGLLIGGSGPGAGTTGPVTHIEASLVCGGGGGMVVATTAAVTLSPEGDAELEAKLTLPITTPPTPCFGTIILVRVAGLSTGTLPANPPFIAVTGFIPQAGEGEDDHDGDN
jgi:hypothetical protein